MVRPGASQEPHDPKPYDPRPYDHEHRDDTCPSGRGGKAARGRRRPALRPEGLRQDDGRRHRRGRRAEQASPLSPLRVQEGAPHGPARAAQGRAGRRRHRGGLRCGRGRSRCRRGRSRRRSGRSAARHARRLVRVRRGAPLRLAAVSGHHRGSGRAGPPRRAAGAAAGRRRGPAAGIRALLPEAQLEPLGETIRSSLYGLALLWLDRPELEREVLVAAMVRVVRGILLSAS